MPIAVGVEMVAGEKVAFAGAQFQRDGALGSAHLKREAVVDPLVSRARVAGIWTDVSTRKQAVDLGRR